MNNNMKKVIPGQRNNHDITKCYDPNVSTLRNISLQKISDNIWKDAMVPDPYAPTEEKKSKRARTSTPY